jgi:hypothetical protein
LLAGLGAGRPSFQGVLLALCLGKLALKHPATKSR